MKLNKPLFNKLLFSTLVAVAALILSAEVKAQTNLNKAITAHINKIREDAVEYKQARKIVYGDVDGDVSKDAVVQYTLEGFGGGNSWGQQLAVFLNKNGVYNFAAEETVGGKFLRSFTVTKVVNKAIIGATETCPEDEPQGICKNPAKGKMKFVLADGKLLEK